MGLLCAEYGFSINATSLFGMMAISGGVVGSGLFGVIVEYRKNHKQVITLLSLFTIITPIMMLISLSTSTEWLVAVSLFFVGFIGISIQPLGLDFAVELTYPVSEAVSSGLMLTSMNVFGTVFSVACSALIGSMD